MPPPLGPPGGGREEGLDPRGAVETTAPGGEGQTSVEVSPKRRTPVGPYPLGDCQGNEGVTDHAPGLGTRRSPGASEGPLSSWRPGSGPRRGTGHPWLEDVSYH